MVLLIVASPRTKLLKIVSKYSFKKINQYKLASLLFCGRRCWRRLIVIEMDRLCFEIHFAEEIAQQHLEMLKRRSFLFAKGHPNLDSEAVNLWIFRRDEPKPVDFLWVFVALTNQVKHRTLVNLFFILMALCNREDEAAALSVFGVLPLGLNPFLETFDWIDFSPLFFDEVTKWREKVRILLNILSREVVGQRRERRVIPNICEISRWFQSVDQGNVVVVVFIGVRWLAHEAEPNWPLIQE